MESITKKQERSITKRKMILKKAKSLFLKDGYKRTTINRIAQAAAISPGNIYLYFKSKEDLYISVSMDTLTRFTEDFNTIITDGTWPVDKKITTLKHFFIKRLEEDSISLTPLLQSQQFISSNKLSPEIIRKKKALTSRFEKEVTRIVRKGVDQGIFHNESQVVITNVILGFFSGLVCILNSRRNLNIEGRHSKKSMEIAFDVFFSGLVTHREKDLKPAPKLKYKLKELSC